MPLQRLIFLSKGMTHISYHLIMDDRIQEDLQRLQRLLDSKEEQISRVNKDLDFWRLRFNTAEERAQREVCKCHQSKFVGCEGWKYIFHPIEIFSNLP